ncbi:hypothetical protein [Providencia sp. PROV132]|uniref:hypothetical protein n=1 Tax=Providencia sp. PROV132 TaxID=2949842 RepID=UPI00234B6EB6|nr:hypothetical protein [Providencia sp. PROV132]
MNKGILFTLILVFASGCTTKKLDAPYGFKWGQTPVDIKKLNLKGLQCTEFEEGGALCSSENSPQIANKLFLLMFSREKKYINVSFFSRKR